MADAALDPRRHVTVSASAGTGKTWLLTARIVRLLLAGAPAGGILALTFTRKAAAEMRERVAARLRALAFADDAALAAQLAEIGLDTTPELAARARGLYEELQFSPWPLRAMTLHAFCQELVGRFALQCGVVPGAQLTESEGELRSAAWQGLQQHLLREPESAEAAALHRLIAEGHNEWKLREQVLAFLERRNDWRAWAAGDGGGDALGRLDAALRERLHLDERADDALATPDFDTALREAHRLLELVEGIGRVKAAALLPALGANAAARLDALQDALFTQKGEPYQFEIGKGKLKQLGESQAARLAQLHARLVEQVAAILEQRRRAATHARTLAACTLGAAALRAFEDELRQRAVLPFAELEWHASRLLADPDTAGWVQYKLDQRIDHLLVDEFQDTSNTQWRLLLPILEEMAAGGERARSAFLVGDIKQSIYGFRRANPELMPEAERWIAERLGGQRESLQSSRRSAPAVIDCVNAVFAQDEARALLPDFPLHATHRSGDSGRVELAPLFDERVDRAPDAPFRNPLTTPRNDPENRRAALEGERIAQRIEALVAARPAVHGRALGYGDVMILLRKRKHQQAIEQALTRRGIPFTGAARGTLLDTVEARDLMALLRFLDSPGRDLDLAHALRSPVFAWSDEQLAALMYAARERGCSAFEALAGDAAQTLGRWLQAARVLPPHDLLDRICDEGNLAARYEAALPPVTAARARANLNAFLQLALEVDSGRSPSLSKFLRQLKQWSGQEAPDEAPPPGQGAQVRILTVHAAKGLEAPAVFLAQAASPGKNSAAGWLVDWPQGAGAPALLLLGGRKNEHDTLTARLLAERQQREAREDLNLLYVALTRARQFLHVSGFAPLGGGVSRWHALVQAALAALAAAAADDGTLSIASGAPQAAAAAVAPPAIPDPDPRLRRPLAPRSPRAVPEPAEDAAAVRRGNAVHLLLQHLAVPAPPAESRLLALMQARLDCTPAEFTAWLQEARGVLATRALAAFFDPARIRRAWNEAPLLGEDGSGAMDRLVDDGECLWILDYKTDRSAHDASDDTLLQRHREQLERYRTAVRRLWPGRRVRAGLVPTAAPRWVELPE